MPNNLPFSERLTAVMAAARELAIQSGDSCADTQNVVTAMLQEGTSATALALTNLGITVASFTKACKDTPINCSNRGRQYSESVEKALDYAKEIAVMLEHREICPAHLFCGIMQLGECVATNAFKELGISLAKAYHAVMDAYLKKVGPGASKPPGLPRRGRIASAHFNPPIYGDAGKYGDLEMILRRLISNIAPNLPIRSITIEQ